MTRDWRDSDSLLAVRLDGIGDLLMTTPALRALKQRTRRLTLLTSPAASVAAEGLPFVDDVVTFRAPWVKCRAPASAEQVSELAAELRGRRFDGAVVFTVYTQSALPAAMLAHAAGIPRRAAHCRENPYELLTDWVPDPDRDPREGVRHEVRRQLDLVAAIGAPATDENLCYEVSVDARASMLGKARDAGLDPWARWLVVHPGATAPSRRYPNDRFADAVRRLARDPRFQVVLAGGDDDIAAVSAIRSAAPSVASLAARLDWSELAALIERASVLVCNNSGPAHLGAAVGTPVVDLYALTNPQHTPWGVTHRTLYRDVPCRWCLKSVCPQGHQRCLADVAPAEIVGAVDELLDECADERVPRPPSEPARTTTCTH